jgi:dTDP-glucose 4,6-dehydratase
MSETRRRHALPARKLEDSYANGCIAASLQVLYRHDAVRGASVENMKLFVTGGAGFIGSNYIRKALQNGDEVTNFDALTYAGNPSTIEDLDKNPGYRFVKGDIRDIDAVNAAIAGHDAVVHFAAESHVDRSIAGPQEFVSTNCVGTSVVMHAALQNDIARVLHISTDETYGSIEEGSFGESDKLGPRSPYSASKAGSDLIALSYFTTYGLNVSVSRASNNYGPYQHPEKLIPRFTTNLIEGKNVPLMGDGGNVRDWMFVDDHVSGVDVVLRNGEPGEVYNIGAGNEVTNKEITMTLLQLLDKDESFITPIPDRLGHDRRYSVDTAKTQALGWKPQQDLRTGLEATVKWYLDNRWWWQPLKQRDDATGGV